MKGERMDLRLGDCVEVMKTLPHASVDSVVCDPPAAISFMNKSWDDDKGGRTGWVAWLTEVMREALRVLKPGGHAVVWALPRTAHWTAWALEDAGFEVRDAVLHCFGAGFPKSQDISKFIDKAAGVERTNIYRSTTVRPTANSTSHRGTHICNNCGKYYGSAAANCHCPKSEAVTDAAKKWAGWGSALKPSQEIWWLCRKPLDGTLAANTLRHGVGGLNIDGCRISTDDKLGGGHSTQGQQMQDGWHRPWMDDPAAVAANAERSKAAVAKAESLGRWPANLLLSHSPSCVHLDTADDTDLWACVPGCPIRALDAQSGTGKTVEGASRYFMRFDPMHAPFVYQAKANTKDRSAGMEGRNSHPTVKSTMLMAYLCRLVTPPGGIVLDPFMGSGSTGVAALREGFRFIGIEREQEYFDIAKQRMEHAEREKS